MKMLLTEMIDQQSEHALHAIVLPNLSVFFLFSFFPFFHPCVCCLFPSISISHPVMCVFSLPSQFHPVMCAFFCHIHNLTQSCVPFPFHLNLTQSCVPFSLPPQSHLVMCLFSSISNSPSHVLFPLPSQPHHHMCLFSVTSQSHPVMCAFSPSMSISPSHVCLFPDTSQSHPVMWVFFLSYHNFTQSCVFFSHTFLVSH